MRNYFEAERVIIPFTKVARISKALDKNGKIYNVNIFLDGAESASFADNEAVRFILEYKRWLDHATDASPMMPLGSVELVEE